VKIFKKKTNLKKIEYNYQSRYSQALIMCISKKERRMQQVTQNDMSTHPQPLKLLTADNAYIPSANFSLCPGTKSQFCHMVRDDTRA
jgi:hypothetical protein